MPDMIRAVVALACLVSSSFAWASDEKHPSYPHFAYEVVRAHEIKPHRRTIPLEGIDRGSNQLKLTLIVSATGNVVEAKASGEPKLMQYWPQLLGEVRLWKFLPFEKNGNAVTAEVEEYLDLVPPERLPTRHVAAPALQPNSKITITLERSGCFGTCPGYSVAASTAGIVFDGGLFVVAAGKHTDKVDADGVRELAQKFVAADFYSMDAEYRAAVTDNPTYVLSIEIDGRAKKVVDYVGSWVGMPAAIGVLEEDVDGLAGTTRWVKGTEGLVAALQAEKFNFQSYEAQVILKEAASRGEAGTVRELLEAGVPLKPFPVPAPKHTYEGVPFEHVGWLNAASRHAEVLDVLLRAGASKNDRRDKDLALAGAADSGDVEAVRALIAYGANPNADLSKLMMTRSSGGMTTEGQGAGSILIEAARSGNPEMVRELLRCHPNLEARDREGKTAMFAAGEYRDRDEDGARVKCVRLLAEAGADVNARDSKGNTPLHETYLTDVEEELLKLGADVNARNENGETPIFTTLGMTSGCGGNPPAKNAKDGHSIFGKIRRKDSLASGLRGRYGRAAGAPFAG